MAVRIKIHDKEFKRAFRNATVSGLKRSSLFYQSKTKEAVNKSNLRGTRPSKPGQPPHKGTGFGQRNIVWEFDSSQPAARVGVRSNALYMFFHEIGIRGVKRPWMIPTLTRNRRQIINLMIAAGRRAIK